MKNLIESLKNPYSKYYKDFLKNSKNQSMLELEFLSFFKEEKHFIKKCNEVMFYNYIKSALSKSEYFIQNEFPYEGDIVFEGKYNLCIRLKTSFLNNRDDKSNNEINKSEKFTNNTIFNFINSKINDTKLDVDLMEFNKKFDCKRKEDISILIICTDTERFINNMTYLLNDYSGILSEDPYINFKKYPNIDFIVFTNCNEAYSDKEFDFNIFNTRNYINFVIPTKLNDDPKQVEINNFVAKLFKDKLIKFYKGRKNKYNKYAYGNLLLQLINFVDMEYPFFKINEENK